MGYQSIANTPEYTSVAPYAIFAVMDGEFTGPGWEDRLTEFAIVLCNAEGRIVFAWETLFNPGRDTGVVHIHHITNEMVANAPGFPEVADDVVALLHNRVHVGNRLEKDIYHLETEFGEMGIKYHSGHAFDLGDLMRDAKFLDMYEEQIIEAINSQEIEHRAMADTMVAAALLPYALEFARMFPERVKAYTDCKIVVQDREPLTLDPPHIGFMAPG